MTRFSAVHRVIAKTVVVLALTAASAQATIIYDFVGTGLPFAGLSSETVAFHLRMPDFVQPPLNGPFVNFTCAQLSSSTNCDISRFGVISFSKQSVLGDFSAQLSFDAGNNAVYSFLFPTGAFGTPGVYTADASGMRNPGTLTVTANPEPATVLIVLGGLCFCGFRRRPPADARGAEAISEPVEHLRA